MTVRAPGLLVELGSLLLALGLFLALATYQLDLPGLYYDEALDAVPSMQLWLGEEKKLDYLRGSGLSLGGLTLPLMIMDYLGVVNTYLLLPFWALFGVGVVSVRALPIFGSAVTVVLSYLFLKTLFQPWVAALTVLLLAVHPSFVFWSRQGLYVTSIMTVMTVGSLLCLLLWSRGRSGWYLALGLYLLGLGLSAKFLFLWFVVALGAALLVLRGLPRLRPWARAIAPASGFIAWPVRESFRPSSEDTPAHPLLPRPLGWSQALLATAAFIWGAAPFLLFNLQTAGTFRVLAENWRITRYGVNNLDFLSNLGVELDAFAALLQGGHFWYLGWLFSNNLYLPAFLAAVTVLGLIILGVPQARGLATPWAFFLLLIALIVVQSSFTISGLGPTHLFLLLPWPQALIALALYAAVRYLPWRRLALAVGAVVFVALFGLDLWNSIQYHRVLSQTGGWSTHSDAIYQLAAYLDREAISEPIAMDWGIKTSVQLLTQGRVNPVEIFQHSREPNQTFVDWLYGAMTQRNTVYLFHTPEVTIYPRFAVFEEWADKLRKRIELMVTFRQRDGRGVLEVYRLHESS